MKNIKLNMQVTQLIRDFIIENSYADLKEFDNSALIFKEGLLDSMGFMKLITFVEEEFDIEILDDDMIEENFESIKAISNYVTRMLAIRKEKSA